LDLEKTTIYIGGKERHGMTFTTIAWVKDLDGQGLQPPFSYDWYENMIKVISVTIRTME